MSACLLCDTQKHVLLCPKTGCRSVVLRVVAPVSVDAKHLQGRFQASGIRARYANQLAHQIADLGTGEVLLPRVDNLGQLLDELSGLALETRVVEESIATA